MAPLFKDGKYERGYIAIQINANYSKLIPDLLFQQPSPASFAGIFDQSKQIFGDYEQLYFKNGTDISPENWRNQSDYNSYAQKLVSNTTMETNSTNPSCEVRVSPPEGITLHENYRSENQLFVVVCYWKDSLKQLL